jgi:F0F1-type ATP synthase membrane subunit b/b'
MIEDLANLTKILDEKVKPMVEAIKNADPSKEEYGILLSNFSMTMTLASNVNRTLIDVAQRAQAMQAENKEEEKKDESNN